jgi:butyryl-CoA dehydrogenase
MLDMTEDQAALIEAVADFCTGELDPILEADDESETFRVEMMALMGEQGLCGVPTPEEYGGLGLGYIDYAMVLEEIAKHSVSYAIGVAVTGLPQIILRQFGDDAQRTTWLEPLATGEKLGGFALSESTSGSDAASLRCTATREGDTYILNGSKLWITHGGLADMYIVMARTGGGGPKGISAFIVRGDTEGVRAGKKERKMGLRVSTTAELLLENVVVPVTDRIGPEGIGFNVAMAALDSGRVTIAAIAVGCAAAATEAATEYAKQREQFGKPIIDFQGVGFMLADMATQTDAARLMAHRAANMRDRGVPYSKEAAMAKLFATDTAMAVTTDAVQVFGGNGYTREYPVERYMRDAKVLQILEGTNQIQRLVISRYLKKGR